MQECQQAQQAGGPAAAGAKGLELGQEGAVALCASCTRRRDTPHKREHKESESKQKLAQSDPHFRKIALVAKKEGQGPGRRHEEGWDVATQ